MGACCCTGRCREPNGSCSAWPYGYGKFSPHNYDMNFKDTVYSHLNELTDKLQKITEKLEKLMKEIE